MSMTTKRTFKSWVWSKLRLNTLRCGKKCVLLINFSERWRIYEYENKQSFIGWQKRTKKLKQIFSWLKSISIRLLTMIVDPYVKQETFVRQQIISDYNMSNNNCRTISTVVFTSKEYTIVVYLKARIKVQVCWLNLNQHFPKPLFLGLDFIINFLFI